MLSIHDAKTEKYIKIYKLFHTVECTDNLSYAASIFILLRRKLIKITIFGGYIRF